MDLAAAILPERLLFDPPAGNDYETDHIIDHLSQQHERELSRLWDEHQSQLQVLKVHQDATLQVRDNTHDSALRDLRARVHRFDTQLQDVHVENQRLQRQALILVMPDMSLVMGRATC